MFVNLCELHQATTVYIRWAQQKDFSTEIQCLRIEHPVQTKSEIQSLDRFLEKIGIFHVGGRYEAKHASILPKNLYCHQINSRVYTQKTPSCQLFIIISSIISQRYWIIGQINK